MNIHPSRSVGVPRLTQTLSHILMTTNEHVPARSPPFINLIMKVRIKAFNVTKLFESFWSFDFQKLQNYHLSHWAVKIVIV